jgi:hypothetical protein
MLGGSAESKALFSETGAVPVSGAEEAIEAAKTYLVQTGQKERL